MQEQNSANLCKKGIITEKNYSLQKNPKKTTAQHIRIFSQLLKENNYYKGCQKY